ncbi:MAG: cobalamin biosynthesis protein CbiX [Opitutae bacterium]|jgi:hypothetical protein|nr:cobalamin biosynthesis protein CbiX [Opitutae bacterium]MBT5715977.1 cobalamin biosynthesis protein CbiX [Opitutae bacterium]
MNLPICLLVDNGSLRSEAILSHRRVAQRLSVATQFEVLPVGLLHSHKIAPYQLNGTKAETIENFLASERGQSETELLILPLFLGPSRGVTEWLVEKLDAWKESATGRSYRVLDCLHSDSDSRLAMALNSEINELLIRESLLTPRVAMVDHGTPILEVNRVREEVGRMLFKILNAGILGFSTCSMERRGGDRYSFNEPLLKTLLLKWGQEGSRDVVVALFFLLPGRHAGKNGDIDEICDEATAMFPQMKIYQTKPLGEHEIVFSILKEKLESAKSSK